MPFASSSSIIIKNEITKDWAIDCLSRTTKSGRPPARSNAASGSEVCSDTIGEQRRGVHLGHHARRWSAPSRLAAAIYDGSRPDLAEQAFAFDRDLRHLPFATSDSRGCWVSFEYFGHTAGRVLTTNIEDQADHSRA